MAQREPLFRLISQLLRGVCAPGVCTCVRTCVLLPRCASKTQSPALGLSCPTTGCTRLTASVGSSAVSTDVSSELAQGRSGLCFHSSSRLGGQDVTQPELATEPPAGLRALAGASLGRGLLFSPKRPGVWSREKGKATEAKPLFAESQALHGRHVGPLWGWGHPRQWCPTQTSLSCGSYGCFLLVRVILFGFPQALEETAPSKPLPLLM